MPIIIKTAGLLWFIKGCMMLVHASEPGVQREGFKGMAFLFAGILAMNFDNTLGFLTWLMEKIVELKLTVNT